MDPEASSLAAAAASAVVTAVVRDGWTYVREKVKAHLRSAPDAVEMIEPAAAAPERDTARASVAEALALLLDENPGLASELRELVAALGVPTVSLDAKASGKARIYQQGSGIQINR